MNAKTRVLIVDDSVVIRRLLTDVLSADPQLQVAGHAANGQIALAMLDQVSPDLVTLDVEMPVMDGLETLKAIRAKSKRLPVVMFSTLTERGAAATIDALTLGASDYVTKPANVGNFTQAKESVRDILIPKIKALCGIGPLLPERAPKRAVPSLQRITRRSGPMEIVAVGSSTGGPNALAELFQRLPPDFSVPILIVQHMPPAFTHFLAQRLSVSAKRPVQEAVAGTVVEPGSVWIAPGDHHMVVIRERNVTRLELNQDCPENSCRPSVDVLFRSVANAYRGSNVLAVVLTGMGQDGLRGCEQLADAGAHIVAQDEATSVVWGMPGFVAKAGLANAVVPITEVGSYIARQAAIFSRGEFSRPRAMGLP